MCFPCSVPEDANPEEKTNGSRLRFSLLILLKEKGNAT
jgi:hypothetical protein